MVDASAHGQSGENPFRWIKENAASYATISDLVGAENMCGVEIGAAFERQGVELELALANRGETSSFIDWWHGRSRGFVCGRCSNLAAMVASLLTDLLVALEEI